MRSEVELTDRIRDPQNKEVQTTITRQLKFKDTDQEQLINYKISKKDQKIYENTIFIKRYNQDGVIVGVPKLAKMSIDQNDLCEYKEGFVWDQTKGQLILEIK